MKNAYRERQKEQPPVIGVIAEYDPFHNGHALHIAGARKALNTSAAVVVALSSAFTQRGLPAFACKTARAKMALANGADLVLELPFVYACNSAQKFARGAVEILAATRLVTHLAFGAEDAPAFAVKNVRNVNKNTSAVPEDSELNKLVNILIQEPLSFKLNLKGNLAAGCSYPKAAALALERELPGAGRFVSSPNNLLAVSYLAEIKRGGHSITPIPLQRVGSAHNDETPCENAGAGKNIASASAIRKALLNENWERESSVWVNDAVPPSAMSVLREERDGGRLCLADSTERLWLLLRGLLARSAPGDLRECAGMEEGLENLFLKHYARADSFEDFIGRCVCARYTRTRLLRQAARCLAGLGRWTEEALTRSAPPYIRVLGYSDAGRGLLRLRKKLTGAVPVITRLSAANAISAPARQTADAEFRASRLRELLLPHPDLTGEEKIIPIAQCFQPY